MSTMTAPTGALRHALVVPLTGIEWRQAENGRSEDYTLRGHAAVFNSLSGDLGGFREIIEPGAFRAALRSNPDVRLLFNHDANYVMARTASGTLELREDAQGLHVWARVAPLGWVSDLRASMQRGDIDQMSFAFTLRDGEGADDWAVTDDGQIVRTIRADGIADLFDVSVVTYPAYEATDAGMRELRDAVNRGRLPVSVLGEPTDGQNAAPDDTPVAVSAPRTDGGGARKQLALAKARRAAETTPSPRKDPA